MSACLLVVVRIRNIRNSCSNKRDYPAFEYNGQCQKEEITNNKKRKEKKKSRNETKRNQTNFLDFDPDMRPRLACERERVCGCVCVSVIHSAADLKFASCSILFAF